MIAILNPWVLRLLMNPIVETALLFCILATFYCLFRGSRLSYLFASIASLVRYEGAVLILTVFIIDLAIRKTRKARRLTFLCVFLSAAPLLLWLLGGWRSPEGIYYLKTFNQNQDPFSLKIYQIWEVTFSSLLKPLSSPAFNWSVFAAAKIIVVFGIISGIGCALSARRWQIMALLIFFTGYFFIHLFYLTLWRYWVPVFWIVLFIWWYGWQNFWGSVKRKIRVPEGLVWAGMGVILASAGFWVISSLAGLSRLAAARGGSVSIPYVATGAVLVLFAGRLFYYRDGQWRRDLTASILVCSLVVANQYALIDKVGSGRGNIEFKYLAQWYRRHAGRDEKMVSAMAPLLQVFVPERENNFIPIADIEAKNPEEFIRECRRRGITYITWDSRMCSNAGWRFYESWGLDNIAVLSQPRSTGAYEFVTQIINDNGPHRYVNVFRLAP